EAVADEPEPPEAPENAPAMRRHPLRFTWQMDEANRFFLGSYEFTRLIGARTATGFGRPWDEIAETFGLDPAGRIAEAIATRATWNGITCYWPGEHRGPRRGSLASRAGRGAPLAGRSVGPGGVGRPTQCRRLSWFWRVPRSRQPRASRRA